MSERFIKPIATRPIELYEETGEDGMPIQIVIEHFRQGERYYRIIWRSDADPMVEDEAADAAE